MAGRSIGATLVLKAGEFYTNVKKAESGVQNLKNKFASGNAANKTYRSGIDKTSSSLKSMAKSAVSAVAAYVSVREIVNVTKECIEAANQQIRVEERLDQLMMNVQGTTKRAVDEVKNYAAELQTVTTVGDEVTIQGASQLATFQLQGDTIKKLLPSLQDLAVSQYGVKVTGDQMQQMANLLGKVMTGNVGALTRYGVTMTDTQKKLLKTGSEASRAAMLVDVLGQNFGGLAERMAQTPEGAVIQLNNALGDLKEQMGIAIMPLVEKFAGYINRNMPRIAEITESACDKIGKGVGWVTQNADWLVPALTGAATAIIGVSVAMGIMNLVMIASPVTWIVLGIIAAVGALVAIGVALYKNWGKIKESFSTNEKITGCIASIKGAFQSFWEFVQPLWNALTIYWSFIWDGIKNYFGFVWENIKVVFQTALDVVSGIFNFWAAVFRGDWSGAWEAVKGVFVSLWEGIKKIFGNFIEYIKKQWQNLKDFLKKPIEGVVKLFKRSEEDGESDTVTVDGSHRGGLPRVPFDGYIARLHKNERVLTAEENRQYISGGNKTTNNVFKFYITTNELNDEAVDKFASKVQFALANM